MVVTRQSSILYFLGFVAYWWIRENIKMILGLINEVRKMKFLTIGVLAITFSALAGCGQGLSGKYSDKGNIMSLEFKSNGKVIVPNPYGGFFEYKYSMDENTVKIHKGESEDMILGILKNGCLSFMAREVCKIN